MSDPTAPRDKPQPKRWFLVGARRTPTVSMSIVGAPPTFDVPHYGYYFSFPEGSGSGSGYGCSCGAVSPHPIPNCGTPDCPMVLLLP